MEHWPRPEYTSESWLTETPEDLASAVLDAFDNTKLNRHDAWTAITDVPRFRTFKLPFYNNVLLVEFQLERSFDDGYILGAYLAAPKNQEHDGPAPQPADAANDRLPSSPTYELYWLDGKSWSIHQVNSEHDFISDTPDKALAYLKFFCAHVWGDDGGFWIGDNVDNLPWLPTASDNTKQQVRDALITPKPSANDEEIWTIDATVLYNQVLFAAKFAVQKTGMIEMLDDNPLMDDPLPVFKDRRLHSYRVVPAQALPHQ